METLKKSLTEFSRSGIPLLRVYVDETKIKAQNKTYYLWLVVDEEEILGPLSWFFTTQRQLTRDHSM